MKRLLTLAFLAGTLSLPGMVTASAATVVAKVDVKTQTMIVTHHGKVKYKWKVSTGRFGHGTPKGTYTAQWLDKDHVSTEWNSPMPYSIFYDGDFAIHGTAYVERLGNKASAGCVRLHPDNARVLYTLAEEVGLRNVKIVIEGGDPSETRKERVRLFTEGNSDR